MNKRIVEDWGFDVEVISQNRKNIFFAVPFQMIMPLPFS